MEEHWPQKMAEMVMNVDKSGECFFERSYDDELMDIVLGVASDEQILVMIYYV